MKKTDITVTEAARNFAECVNRVHYQNQVFVLVKNGKPIARLIPEEEKICTGKDLAEALGHVSLSNKDAEEWRKDLVAARKTLERQGDKWQ